MKWNRLFAAGIAFCLFFSVSACGNVTQSRDADSAAESIGRDSEETSAVSSDSADTTTGQSGEREVSGASEEAALEETGGSISLEEIPAYSGNPYTIVNENVPFFSENEVTTDAFETYSELDALGRCGVAYTNICTELMPTEERGQIGEVKPTGWHLVKYDGIDGNYLYNRCHLIGFQLAGENANEKNLITGTRYLNVDGMLPYENLVAEYVKDTGNHVLYRVTPLFDGDNLLASGVLMEGWSVEDAGGGICFNVYCYNVQPGIGIDYATGDSWTATDQTESGESTIGIANGKVTESSDEDISSAQSGQENASVTESGNEQTYILNTNTKKFHYPDCSSVEQMKEKNKAEFAGTRDEAIRMGYEPCGNCKP